MKNGIAFNQLSASIIGTICILIAALMYFIPSNLDPTNKGVIIGFLVAQATSCIHFIVGSSSGSQNKDEGSKNTTDMLVDKLANSAPPEKKPQS